VTLTIRLASGRFQHLVPRIAGGDGGGSGEAEFSGRVLPAAGSEPRRRHRSPGLGTAHPRFSGGPFDLWARFLRLNANLDLGAVLGAG
jgi:hypothetical protein